MKTKCKACKTTYTVYDKPSWTDAHLPCPVCGALFSVLPETERRLAILQEKYLRDRDETYMTQIFRILYNDGYVRNILKKSSLTYPENDDDYYAYVASVKVVERFYKSPDFKLRSFGGYVKTKLLEALYQKSELPQEVIIHKAGFGSVSIDYDRLNETIECPHIQEVDDNDNDAMVLDRVREWVRSAMGWSGIGGLVSLYGKLEGLGLDRFWSVTEIER